jgi:hypothetical protein
MKFKKLIVLGSVVASLTVVSQSAFACGCKCEKKPVPGGGYEYFNCK